MRPHIRLDKPHQCPITQDKHFYHRYKKKTNIMIPQVILNGINDLNVYSNK